MEVVTNIFFLYFIPFRPGGVSAILENVPRWKSGGQRAKTKTSRYCYGGRDTIKRVEDFTRQCITRVFCNLCQKKKQKKNEWRSFNAREKR